MLYTAKSHTGLVRQMNQDSYKVQSVGNWTLIVVADGMGGAAAGEIASQMAAEVIVREVESRIIAGNDPVFTLRDAITLANQEIWKKSRSDVDYLGMGTTLVTALYNHETVILGHVGDSRAYFYTGGRLEQITRDHSLVAELVRRGQITENEALSHPQRNVVTRSLGTAEWSDPEIDTLEWADGSVLLLCTDGLTNCVTSEELSAHLSTLVTTTDGSGDNVIVTDAAVGHDGADDAATANVIPAQNGARPLDDDVTGNRERQQENDAPVASPEALQGQLDSVAQALVDLTLNRGAPDNVTVVLTLHRKEIGAN